MKKLLSQNLQKIIIVLLFLIPVITGHSQVKKLKIKNNFAKFLLPKACTSNPIIQCPSDFFACPGASTLPFNTGFATGEPGGPNCSSPVLSYKDLVISSGPCNGSTEIERTWTATDPQNNNLKSTCIQKIKLSDPLAPVITNCPSNIKATAGHDCKANVTWAPPTVSDNCGKLFLTVSHISGDAFPLGNTTVTYTAEDLCGNMTLCSFNITVEGTCCKTNPKIICVNDYNGCVGDTILPHITGFPTTSPGDTSCSQPSLNYKDSILSSGPCQGAMKVQRFWKAFDPYDGTLYSTCIQVIELKDQEMPTITNVPANITVSPGHDCKAMVQWIEPLITDKCGIKSITKSHLPGSLFSTGTTTITYIATDHCNNVVNASFTITVTSCCTAPPIIQCPLNYSACPNTTVDPNHTGKATATKSSPECGEAIITYTDSVINYSCPGAKMIFRKWKAIDPHNANLVASCTQLIELKDVQAPEFKSCPANITVNANPPDCKAIVQWNNPIAVDNCSANLTISSNYNSGSTFSEGTTTIIINVKDDCGNIAQHTFTITVIGNCCNEKPKINCPPNYIGCPIEYCNTNQSGTATAYPGNPGCAQPVITYKDSLINIYSFCQHARKFIRIWKATDPNDLKNYSICYQTIDLVDKSPPIWNSCPPNITINAYGACEKSVQWNAPIASDNCSNVTITSNYKSGDLFPTGTTTVIYYAKDECGNSIQHQFIITVIGNGLKIECPNDIVIEKKDHYGTTVTWAPPKVTTCGNCKDSLKGFMYMGTFNGSQYFCSRITTTWEEARQICNSLGGKLCVINSKEENDYLTSKLMGTTAFIGLHDSNIEGQFEWVDNSALSYVNWYPGQPNNANGDQDYVEMLPDGTWNDQYGKNCYREFICEISCYNIKQIEGPPPGSLFKCGTTWVTYIATQGNATDTCKFSVTVNCNNYNKYCESRAQNCGLMWIKNVHLGNLNNTSGNSVNGYTDFTNLCADLKWGKQFDICLTPGFANQNYNVYWKVWIDYNADGDFIDQDEFVAYGVSNTTLCGKISLPWNCQCQVINTRMRVAMSYGSYPGNSCCVFAYGEVEDYCVNLSQGNFGPGSQTESKVTIDPIEIFPDHTQVPFLDQRSATISEENVEIIPNPSNDVVNILSNVNPSSTIKIFNTEGKQIQRTNLLQLNYQLDVSQWNEGIYFIIIESTNGNQLLQKLSVIHE